MDRRRTSGFTTGGMFWEGSLNEFNAWREYKKAKAQAMIKRGCVASWDSDADNWMSVLLRPTDRPDAAEYRASVKFFQQPSDLGIDGGRISKLSICLHVSPVPTQARNKQQEFVEVLYEYDRDLVTDRLSEDTTARSLYEAVLDELN